MVTPMTSLIMSSGEQAHVTCCNITSSLLMPRVRIYPAIGEALEGNSTLMDDQQNKKQVYFPIMSFWPVDL